MQLVFCTSSVERRSNQNQAVSRRDARNKGRESVGQHFPDHVVPQSQGGSDHLENLQLLCGACNSVKGNRDHAVLIATLRERGVLPAS